MAWDSQGAYHIHLADGRALQADLLPGAIAHPRLLALRFQGSDGQVYRLIQPVSSASIQQFAALRRQLLHPRGKGGEHSSPSA